MFTSLQCSATVNASGNHLLEQWWQLTWQLVERMLLSLCLERLENPGISSNSWAERDVIGPACRQQMHAHCRVRYGNNAFYQHVQPDMSDAASHTRTCVQQMLLSGTFMVPYNPITFLILVLAPY